MCDIDIYFWKKFFNTALEAVKMAPISIMQIALIGNLPVSRLPYWGLECSKNDFEITLLEKDVPMLTYDFSPLYRNFVGLDRMAGLIDAAAASASNTNSYPPYNVVRLSNDEYRIELAVSGFTQEQIDIQTHEGVLSVKAQSAQANFAGPKETADNDSAEYLHRGIAQRSFEKRFQLADHVTVTSANLLNGLLTISLKRELPEALKPRKITIDNKDEQKLITPDTGNASKAA